MQLILADLQVATICCYTSLWSREKGVAAPQDLKCLHGAWLRPPSGIWAGLGASFAMEQLRAAPPSLCGNCQTASWGGPSTGGPLSPGVIWCPRPYLVPHNPGLACGSGTLAGPTITLGPVPDCRFPGTTGFLPFSIYIKTKHQTLPTLIAKLSKPIMKAKPLLVQKSSEPSWLKSIISTVTNSSLPWDWWGITGI